MQCSMSSQEYSIITKCYAHVKCCGTVPRCVGMLLGFHINIINDICSSFVISRKTKSLRCTIQWNLIDVRALHEKKFSLRFYLKLGEGGLLLEAVGRFSANKASAPAVQAKNNIVPVMPLELASVD